MNSLKLRRSYIYMSDDSQTFRRKAKVLTQDVDSEPVHEMVLKAIEIEHKGKSLRQFIENSIRFSGLLQQRLGNVFQFPQQRASQTLKKSRTESEFILKSITKMGFGHKEHDLSP